MIRRPEQLELLASPLRQQVVATVAELGECSISELASELGCPADSLYYHVRKLAKAGLLLSGGKRATDGRDEEVFRVPGSDIRLDYDLSKPRAVAAIQRAAAALLRLARRDFERGAEHAQARSRGAARNLRVGRATAWLSREQLGELNELLGRIDTLLTRTPPEPGKQLHAFSFVLAPVEQKER